MIEALITVYIVGAIISLYLASALLIPGKSGAGEKLLAAIFFWPAILFFLAVKGLIRIWKGE